ncbi:SGNH/GDSL hydrolase family protein, partial [Klebsiella pneumoniae]
MTVTIMYPGIDMASINETAQWENEIYQIARGDKVEGGRGGAANIQAKQLGNRTRYLYDQMQAIMTSAFTGIYHASDEENGLTHTSEGELFFTSNGPDDEFIFSFFINQGGVA